MCDGLRSKDSLPSALHCGDDILLLMEVLPVAVAPQVNQIEAASQVISRA